MPDVRLIAVIVLLAVVGVLIVVAASSVRRSGARFRAEVVVRCTAGHLYTTIWIPGGSFKAIRLGLVRLQHCPVGEHWAFVVPVPDSDLTDQDRWIAAQYRDGPIP